MVDKGFVKARNLGVAMYARVLSAVLIVSMASSCMDAEQVPCIDPVLKIDPASAPATSEQLLSELERHANNAELPDIFDRYAPVNPRIMGLREYRDSLGVLISQTPCEFYLPLLESAVRFLDVLPASSLERIEAQPAFAQSLADCGEADRALSLLLETEKLILEASDDGKEESIGSKNGRKAYVGKLLRDVAEVFVKIGELDQARQIVERSSRLNSVEAPTEIDISFFEAISAYERKEFQEAHKLAKDVVVSPRDDEQLLGAYQTVMLSQVAQTLTDSAPLDAFISILADRGVAQEAIWWLTDTTSKLHELGADKLAKQALDEALRLFRDLPKDGRDISELEIAVIGMAYANLGIGDHAQSLLSEAYDLLGQHVEKLTSEDPQNAGYYKGSAEFTIGLIGANMAYAGDLDSARRVADEMLIPAEKARVLWGMTLEHLRKGRLDATCSLLTELSQIVGETVPLAWQEELRRDPEYFYRPDIEMLIEVLAEFAEREADSGDFERAKSLLAAANSLAFRYDDVRWYPFALVTIAAATYRVEAAERSRGDVRRKSGL